MESFRSRLSASTDVFGFGAQWLGAKSQHWVVLGDLLGVYGIRRNLCQKHAFVKNRMRWGALPGGDVAYMGMVTFHTSVKPSFGGGHVLMEKNQFVLGNIHGT